MSVPGYVSLIQLFDPEKLELSILYDPEPTMLRSAQYSFQNIHLKFAVRFQTPENIQNTLSTAFTLRWVSNLAGKYFQASTFLIAELVDMAGFDDFSKVSVSIHMMSQAYESEQYDLKAEAEVLRQEIETQVQQNQNLEQFIQKVKKYAELTELTPYAAHELIKAIYVGAPDKSSGKRRQSIHICYDLMGFIPLSELMTQEMA